MSDCKLHGKHHQEECPECRANFWEQEAVDLKSVLYCIRDFIFEQIPDEQILKKVQDKLKSIYIN